MTTRTAEDARALQIFTEYLRIPSVHPDVDYGPCEQWVRRQAADLDLPVRVEKSKNEKKPVLILSWEGSDPKLPSIMLNSHMDVVPVYPEYWTHEPFSAERNSEGNIYARGSQDMKCVAVHYLEAVRRLKKEGFKPRRTVHITFVPDEEIGSEDGMAAFVETDTFAKLNVGFGLDEGMCYPDHEFIVFHGERSDWKLEFVCPGTPGHGSMLMDNIAADKVRVILDRLQDYRASERAKLTVPLSQGLVTTVNVTMIQGGVQSNVVPPEMKVTADVRLATTVNHDEFLKMVQGWCAEAGEGTELRVLKRGLVEGVTALNESNVWWITFKDVFDKLNLKMITAICPGGTDARFLRRVAIPALGFTAINNTPVLLHSHDEFVNENIFLKGITIYVELLRRLTVL